MQDTATPPQPEPKPAEKVNCTHSPDGRSEYCVECKQLCCFDCSVEHKLCQPTHHIRSPNGLMRHIMVFIRKNLSPETKPEEDYKALTKELGEYQKSVQGKLDSAIGGLKWLKAEVRMFQELPGMQRDDQREKAEMRPRMDELREMCELIEVDDIKERKDWIKEKIEGVMQGIGMVFQARCQDCGKKLTAKKDLARCKGECHGRFCEGCVKECAKCKGVRCKKCRKPCKRCAKEICKVCGKKCGQCKEEGVCEDCFKECARCKGKVCVNCAKSCVKCGAQTCLTCIIGCPRCNTQQVCANCFKKCPRCSTQVCTECVKACPKCSEKEVCTNCFKVCQKCNVLVCTGCLKVCPKCNKR